MLWGSAMEKFRKISNYLQLTLVNYVSRVVITSKLLIFAALESPPIITLFLSTNWKQMRLVVVDLPNWRVIVFDHFLNYNLTHFLSVIIYPTVQNYNSIYLLGAATENHLEMQIEDGYWLCAFVCLVVLLNWIHYTIIKGLQGIRI